jgi:molybdopterin molybdotransferase
VTVTVRLYATLERYGPDGTRPFAVDAPDGVTVAALIPRLGIPPATVHRVFVNGVIRDESYVLHPGDEIGIFPPIAGGASVSEFLHIRSVGDARARFFASWSPAPPRAEALPLARAGGRVLAEDVRSPEDLPAHARSIVDGYAVRAADTFGASEGLPAYLAVAGEVLMGRAPDCDVESGAAVRIPTGGILPSGADAVVMVEHTEVLPGRAPAESGRTSAAMPPEGIEVRRPVGPSENVIRPGEDFRRGDVALKSGTRLRPPHIGLLAGLGITHVRGVMPPRVAILSTGDEVVAPEDRPDAGQIRDINGPALCAAVEAEGADAVFCGIVPDRFDALLDAARTARQNADLVLISGGSSIGLRDEVGRAVDALGAPGVLVHGVAMKPGKPVVLGLCDGTPVVGLPGHPTTVLVVFHVFVREIIGRLLGRASEPAVVQARLTRRVASAAGRTDYLRVRLERRDGALWAAPILGKSGLISTMAGADGLAVVPEAAEGIETGEEVAVEVFVR